MTTVATRTIVVKMRGRHEFSATKSVQPPGFCFSRPPSASASRGVLRVWRWDISVAPLDTSPDAVDVTRAERCASRPPV